MASVSQRYHRVIGCWAFLTSVALFYDAASSGERIRPFSSFGWRAEQANLGLHFLFLSLLICFSVGPHPKARSAGPTSAVALGTIAFLAYARYFTLNLGLLSLASFLDAAGFALPRRKSSAWNRVCFWALCGLTLADIAFLLAGHLLVGA